MCLCPSDLCAHRALALVWPCGNKARIGIYHQNFTPVYLRSWVDFENFEDTTGGCGIPLYKPGAALAGGSIPQHPPPLYPKGPLGMEMGASRLRGVAHRNLGALVALWSKERQGGAPRYHSPSIWDTPGACKLVYLGGGNGPQALRIFSNFILYIIICDSFALRPLLCL
jgi:hypothetical protein